MSKDRIIAKKGMRVHVFSGDRKDSWGFGTIEKVEPLFIGTTMVSKNYPSKIVLDKGKVTEGCECWWHPIKADKNGN